MYLHNLSCCGFKELAGVGEEDMTLADLKMVLQELRRDTGFIPFVTFSGAKEPASEGGFSIGWKEAARLAALIKAHKLGTVYKARVKRNPNTGNRLQVYLWTVSSEGAARFLARKPRKGA